MRKRIAIVSGAGKGIGRAISERLATEGIFVVLVDLDATSIESTFKILGKNKAAVYVADISDEQQVALLFKSIIQQYKRIDAVINNAGIIRDQLIWNMSLKEFDDVINVNLKGTWLMCREAAKIMKEQQEGRIINISSRAWLGNRGQTNYSASKAGVIGLTRSLALELGAFNISVNAVAPGLIETPLTMALKKETRDKLIQTQPTQKIGNAEDVANMVSFLVSEKTNFITGQTLYVDGG
jgi:NAD(P)-dependent dehydrogenase (short-subunit alcohol dehydrogenase family)